jgi:hypothetical protein
VLPICLPIGLLGCKRYFGLIAAAPIEGRLILERNKIVGTPMTIPMRQEPFGSDGASRHIRFHQEVTPGPLLAETYSQTIPSLLPPPPDSPLLLTATARPGCQPHRTPPHRATKKTPTILLLLRRPQPVATATTTCAKLTRKVFVDLQSRRQWTTTTR